MSRWHISGLADRRTAQLLAALVLGAGCATPTRLYEGPARPASEVVVLEVDPTGMQLQSIDDQSVSGYRFELLPGRHTVRFEVSRAVRRTGGLGDAAGFRVPCLVDFIGEANRSYRLEAQLKRRPVAFAQDLFLDISVNEIGGTQQFKGICGGRA